jgi:C4-dicarboxylate transporter DctM subunit
VQVMVRIRPDHAPVSAGDAATGSVRSLLKVWHVALLFVVTLGGIYWGFFSPTEAAAIGAIGALLLGVLLRRLGLREAANAFVETVRTTSALTLIVMASTLFSYFVVQTRIAKNIVDLLASSGLSPTIVMLLIVVFYIALGCFLEGIGMVLVTVPILLPVVLANGFDPVWFGVMLVIVVEIGLIHPPVGMNLFVIRAQAPQIDIRAMYLGVIPFLFAPLVLIALLIAWPEIALWLPRQIR